MLDRAGRRFRVLLIASLGVGLFALYVCQIRILFLMLLVTIAGMAVLMAVQGQFARLGAGSLAIGAVALVSFWIALSVGGEAVTSRLASLFEGSAGHVYYVNRGTFLEHTIVDLAPAYPLGAGLGRHGMIANYFAVQNSESSPIYAEINWTSWVLDGGIPLAVMYALAICTTLLFVFRAASRRLSRQDSWLGRWGVVLFGYDASVLVMTFCAAPFETTLGCDFWLLNAAYFSACAYAFDRTSAGGRGHRVLAGPPRVPHGGSLRADRAKRVPRFRAGGGEVFGDA
jgi:hypothetical protein